MCVMGVCLMFVLFGWVVLICSIWWWVLMCCWILLCWCWVGIGLVCVCMGVMVVWRCGRSSCLRFVEVFGFVELS